MSLSLICLPRFVEVGSFEQPKFYTQICQSIFVLLYLNRVDENGPDLKNLLDCNRFLKIGLIFIRVRISLLQALGLGDKQRGKRRV